MGLDVIIYADLSLKIKGEKNKNKNRIIQTTSNGYSIFLQFLAVTDENPKM